MNNGVNDSIVEFYRSSDKTRHTSDNIDARIYSLIPLLESGKSDYFLDIGCYDGTKTQMLAKLTGARYIYGVDFLSDRLEHARKHGVEARIVDLNANTSLPFERDTFDFIFVGDVIEHIFSPDYLLKEIYRILKPKGYALLTTPNLASWRNRVVLLLGWQPFMTEVSTQYRVGNPRAPAGLPSGHIRVFTPRSMRELPQKYGLDVEYLGGEILPGSTKGLIGRLSSLVDLLVLQTRPMLCDEMVVKLRKK